MKKLLLVSMVLLLCSSNIAAQSIFGKWENRNEEGVVNSIVEVFENDGKVYGKVYRIIKEEDRDRLCTACEGDLKNQPVEGLMIMKGLEKDGEEYSGGTIVDPKTGKEYRCKIWIDEDQPNTLHIRGYIALFYQTRTWKRVQ